MGLFPSAHSEEKTSVNSMARVAALLVLVLAAVPAMATDYTVGDSSGWSTGVDYDTWASDKTFNVGDTLLFSYGFLHTVNEVSKSDYGSCSSGNSLQSFSDQNTKITLDKPGSRYFICGTASHCSGGMKLAVNVGGGGGGSSPTTPTTTPSSGSSPDSPTTTTPSGTSSEPASKNSPTTTTTGASAAAGGGFKGGSAVVVGVSLVGLALMV